MLDRFPSEYFARDGWENATAKGRFCDDLGASATGGGKTLGSSAQSCGETNGFGTAHWKSGGLVRASVVQWPRPSFETTVQLLGDGS